ncbi:MAG: NAD(P)(+) transhydrogenase (Re/Si-specific) subunit beta [Bordetella sp.]|nr:MAG: NAD(P)(+) transhydrogenase (Re/Si-specific) subunit beta [Bordetella sp.]
MNLVTLMYLVASICFIQALKGLSHPTTSRLGNVFGMVGMAIAILTTIAMIINLVNQELYFKVFIWICLSLLIGGTIGIFLTKNIEMTKMPELVALMHSMTGLASVAIAIAIISEPNAFSISLNGLIPIWNRFELFAGTFIGAVTFSGSIIAFGKLSGSYKFRLFSSKPVIFKNQHLINLILACGIIILGVYFILNQSWIPFLCMMIGSFLLGVLMIIPIGGADMPVLVSMLNSYSGWAAAGIGFSLNNPMLIISGSLVGSSGAILSYIMCKAMNRSFLNVVLGGFGSTNEYSKENSIGENRSVKSGSPEDVAFLMSNAESVTIIPGYGLAVSRAQHSLKELADRLSKKGIRVKYAIHTVAGRMPGHMNVLLAEAEVSYDQVFEMEEINSEFSQTDVALVLGANDVVNPAAKNDPASPIAGMPILEAYKARTVIVNKRSMATGYSALENELFYMDNTMMVFGDSKKVIEEMIKFID